MRLVRIGYWAAGTDGLWPSVESFVDRTWDTAERDRALVHLRRGMLVRAYLGFSTCRLCGERNGSTELTDGRFIWPEGLAHYVEAHGVRLPDEFMASIDDVPVWIEDAEVDESWWRSIEAP